MMKTTRNRRPSSALEADRPLVVEPHHVVQPREAGTTHLRELQALSAAELQRLAEAEGIATASVLDRPQLTVEILRSRARRGHTLRGSGTLEVLPDGYGFLRMTRSNYLNSAEDVYVSPA